MGAFVGGQYAMGRCIDEIRDACRRVFLGVRPHRGFNLPVFSLVGRTQQSSDRHHAEVGGGGTVVASIVSAQVANAFTCERVPTVWEMVRGQVTGRRTAAFPTIVEVMMRSVVLHSSTREKASAMDADLAIRPAVAGFGLLAFDRMDDIIEAGYRSGQEHLPAWKAQAEGSLD